MDTVQYAAMGGIRYVVIKKTIPELRLAVAEKGNRKGSTATATTSKCTERKEGTDKRGRGRRGYGTTGGRVWEILGQCTGRTRW
jgi:hypothetical protein